MQAWYQCCDILPTPVITDLDILPTPVMTDLNMAANDQQQTMSDICNASDCEKKENNNNNKQ